MTAILAQLQLTAQADAATGTAPALVVTAGAGSGKTRTLAARFVRLLETGLPLRSLVAITFTDKAAREMRSRIRSRWPTGWRLPRGRPPPLAEDPGRIGRGPHRHHPQLLRRAAARPPR